MTGALGEMRKLKPILDDPEAAKTRLRHFVGLGEGGDIAVLHAEFVEKTLIGREDVLLARNELDPKPEGTRAVDRLAAIVDPAAPTEAELRAVVLTQKGAPRKSLLTKPQAERFPALLATLEAEQQRLLALDAEIIRAALVRRSEALIDLLCAIVGDYERAKRTRARLDFDDLVTRTAALFGDRAQGPWVRYKLDAGITHILVDESQDTNREQWHVVDALADEFFAGEGAAARPRSLFAVGDPKQSIFSFQGAEPALFGAAGDRYRQKATAAGRSFARIPMAASFRTLPEVLDAVDRVFVEGPLRDAVVVGETYTDHLSARVDKGGRVALWPVVQAEKPEQGDSWTPEDKGVSVRTPARQLADTIVGSIAEWVEKGRVLGPRNRAIRADDILVLVQSRGTLFHEIIRALKKRGLPTPGADRLNVGRHIATLDLLALGDVLLNPGDDLSLAALLRSPLFDVSETDLFNLANKRPGSLFDAMRVSPIPGVAEACQRLTGWRQRLDFERPYEFYADVLYAEGGLRRFHARLGGEVDDVVAEFLALALQYEQSSTPSLQGFVADMRARSVEIKRDLGEADSGVRVMTIHGAKGLEALIVILADAASKPQGSQTHRALYFVEPPDGPFLFHASGEAEQTEKTLPIYENEKNGQMAEYWRKLYVGMTRAEDELHVAGILSASGKLDGTWYEAVSGALAGATASRTLSADLEADVFPVSTPADRFVTAASGTEAQAPAPAFAPLVLAKKPQLVTPSTAGPHGDPLDAGNEAAGDADTARRAGIALHALLQYLPGVPEENRETVARAALMSLMPSDLQLHDSLAETGIALVGDPDLASVFGPDTRAEVPILAKGRRGNETVLIAGRIDRLRVTPEAVTIIDFKSDSRPPAHAGSVPPAYLVQLGLYRAVLTRIHADRPVRAAILWTRNGVLMPIPEAALTAAVDDIVV